MDQFYLCYRRGIWLGEFSHFRASGIIHGISSRLKGVSQAPFSSLNLGLHTGDNREDVIANRQMFSQAVGVDLTQVVTAEQVHGTTITTVTRNDCGKGVFLYADAMPASDALITNVQGIPLMLFFADCVPVLIADKKRRAVGICHAGWRGTVDKIAQKTVVAMKEQFGILPEDCLVGIGPSVGRCCYEVDEVVINRLRANFTNYEQLVKPKGARWNFDLWAANRLQLEEIGVAATNIITSNVCTSCNNNLFFSYRAESGNTGRIGAIIAL